MFLVAQNKHTPLDMSTNQNTNYLHTIPPPLTGLWKNPNELNSLPIEHVMGSGSSVPVRTTAIASTFTMVLLLSWLLLVVC
jgi:hypothetical protein